MELHEELTSAKSEVFTLRALLKKSNADKTALDEMYTVTIRQLHEEKSKNALVKEELEDINKKCKEFESKLSALEAKYVGNVCTNPDVVG